jgi:hypothetical protein
LVNNKKCLLYANEFWVVYYIAIVTGKDFGFEEDHMKQMDKMTIFLISVRLFSQSPMSLQKTMSPWRQR